MSTLLVSSKGQIVLPAELRRRLGMGAGARIEVHEESDGLKLRVVRAVATADLTGMAGGEITARGRYARKVRRGRRLRGKLDRRRHQKCG